MSELQHGQGEDYSRWQAPQEVPLGAMAGEVKGSEISLDETSRRVTENLKAEIQQRLGKRPYFSTAEAHSVVEGLESIAQEMKFSRAALVDLKNRGGDALKDYRTSETIKIPTELGDKVFTVRIFFDKSLQRNKFILEELAG